MTVSRKVLCVIYAAIAVMALFATWGQNLQYHHLSMLGFWKQTLVNPASRSITGDIFFFAAAAFIWMALEMRRLKMRGLWVYLIASLLVAVSAAFPVFLIHREFALAKQSDSTSYGSLGVSGVTAIVFLLAIAIGYGIWARYAG